MRCMRTDPSRLPRLASDSARGLCLIEWISWLNRVTRDGIEEIRRVCLLPEWVRLPLTTILKSLCLTDRVDLRAKARVGSLR